LFGLLLGPLLNIGVTLLAFHSLGNIPVRIDAENIPVNEGATTCAAIFSNLLGILSNPTDFFSSI
jgi:uncharacterized membrane protein